jgi:hypothetical protein
MWLAHLLKMLGFLLSSHNIKVESAMDMASRLTCKLQYQRWCNKVCHQQLITQLITEDNLFPFSYELLMTTNVAIQPFWNRVLIKSHIPRKMVSLSSWILTLEKKFSVSSWNSENILCTCLSTQHKKNPFSNLCVSYSQIYTQCTGQQKYTQLACRP